MNNALKYSALFCLLVIIYDKPYAQDSATVFIDAQKTGNRVSPTLHGVFFEEISHGGEGGLYAELIQNRGFEEANIPPGMTLSNGFIVPPQTPHFSLPNHEVSDWKMEWLLKSDFPSWHTGLNNKGIQLSRTLINPLNNASPHSLQVDLSKAGGRAAELVNDGFWGINVTEGSNYTLSFFARTKNYAGTITISLRGSDGTVLAQQNILLQNTGNWKKYHTLLHAAKTDKKAVFVLAFNQPGTVWLDMVSLFPVNTFHQRVNGLRQDLAQYIADLKPAFVRWPGGCFVEGITIQTAPDWKQTIGPIEKRTGTYSPWGYWSTNGFGYFEYLQFCEDIGASALYVFNAGVSCDFRSGTFVADDSLQPYIQSALDAIEYAIGPVNSRWGRVRAAAGHPKPFPLKYVEIGNEQYGQRYAARYNRFYDSIKARYPQVITIASMGIGEVNDNTLRKMNHVEYADEHAYKAAGWAMAQSGHFDHYKRGKGDVYVGEYATNAGVGAGNMEASLNDAVYIMGMEKNGDLVKMSSYAPLLVNSNDVDWPVNLINFDNADSYARISYYAIKLFSENRADLNIDTKVVLTPALSAAPAFAGGIGLATWDTQTEYKELEVLQNGRTIYKSDFAHRPEEWQRVRGNWKTADSGIAQVDAGPQQLMMLKQAQFDVYTLKLKAKKLGGYNAFIVPFALRDSNTFYRAHIGAWVNKVGLFEKVINGYDVTTVSSPVTLTDTISLNKWYNIRLEVGHDTVKCYLDDKLLMTYMSPNTFFAIGGKEDKTGDVLVKLVNGAARSVVANIRLRNSSNNQLSGATLTSLSAPSPAVENSYEHPRQYVPVLQPAPVVSGGSITLAPYSINVLRIPAGSRQPLTKR